MTERQRSGRWWLWLIGALLLLALLAVLAKWWQPLYGFVTDRERIQGWVEQLGVWAPLAIIFLEMIQALLAPIPGQAIEAVSGYLYGPFLGTVWPMIGMALGSFALFQLSRRFGRPLLIRLIGERSVGRLDELVRRGGAPFFFLIWLLPFAPDDLACAAAGLTPMPTRQFMTLMLLGRLPGVFVSVWVGANAARISPLLWALLFAAIAVAVLVFWRWGERLQEAVLRFAERLGRRFGG